MRFARGFVYLWFSLTFGMFLAGAITLWIDLTWSRNTSLPWDGAVLWLMCASFIAMTLVFSQWEQFGERVRLIRWLLLCIFSTFLAVAGVAMGALFAL